MANKGTSAKTEGSNVSTMTALHTGSVTVRWVFPNDPGTWSGTGSHALRRRRLSPECVCPSKPGTFRNRASISGSIWMDYIVLFAPCQQLFANFGRFGEEMCGKGGELGNLAE